MQRSAEELVQIVTAALEDVKADNIRVLNVQALTTMCDYMVIASARSSRQVRAMAERVIEEAGKRGYRPIGTEGQEGGEWVLVDFGDVVVHSMHPLSRAFYQLEKLWDEPKSLPQQNAV